MKKNPSKKSTEKKAVKLQSKKNNPEWANSIIPKPKRLVGMNLDELKEQDLKKFIDLMEEIEYEPFHIFHQKATQD